MPVGGERRLQCQSIGVDLQQTVVEWTSAGIQRNPGVGDMGVEGEGRALSAVDESGLGSFGLLVAAGEQNQQTEQQGCEHSHC